MPKNVTHATQATHESPDANRTPVNVELERVAEAGQKSMFAFAHLHQRLFRNALEVNAELLDFARKRVAEDISTNQKLTSCSSVTDAMEVVSGFYQKAFEEYAEEANRIVQLSTDAARRSMEESQAEAEEISRA